MKLTHHSTPSRTFVLVTIVVLCTVYAALVLTRINKIYLMNAEPAAPITQTTEGDVAQTPTTFEQIQPADTTDWVEFADQDYPITFLRPQGWRVAWNDDLEDLYAISVTQTNPRAQMRIFLSKSPPAEIKNLPSLQSQTAAGYTATNYNNQVYQIKEGEYYYLFDGFDSPENLAELAALVNSAQLE